LHENERRTIIVVTHDLEIAKYAIRLVHLSDGKVEESKNGRKRTGGVK
jgi:putative ABC transport system ATP-binding protein